MLENVKKASFAGEKAMMNADVAHCSPVSVDVDELLTNH